MSLLRKNKLRRERRLLRVRKKIALSQESPRVSIFRSLNNIYGQVIDDNAKITLASSSTLDLSNLKGDKKNKAKQVGIELAKKSLANGIKKVRFDRGKFLFHGRVKAFADGLREGGLEF